MVVKLLPRAFSKVQIVPSLLFDAEQVATTRYQGFLIESTSSHREFSCLHDEVVMLFEAVGCVYISS